MGNVKIYTDKWTGIFQMQRSDGKLFLQFDSWEKYIWISLKINPLVNVVIKALSLNV